MKTPKELADEVSDMTEKEILRQEMEKLLLLSACSNEKEISSMALAMVEIYDRLTTPNMIAPKIKVSIPDDKNLSAGEIANTIKKLITEQMAHVSNKKTDILLSKADIELFQNSADKSYYCETLEEFRMCIPHHIPAYQQLQLKRCGGRGDKRINKRRKNNHV